MSYADNDERRWLAVEKRDRSRDDEFVYAVITTGVYCRPTCRARRPLRQHVRFFNDAGAAEDAGFRPCKRCQPDKSHPHAAQQAKIVQACRLLEASETPLTLEALADKVAISPGYFHRLFKAATGLTPRAWQQARRASKLRDALSGGQKVTRALYDAGYASGSVFYQQADAALGMTARQFRNGGEGVTVYFALGRCQLGEFLVAESERGVCAILLGDEPQALVAELTQSFPKARLTPGDAAFQQRVAQVVGWLERPQGEFALPLDLRGTAFQREVWQALRAIAPGTTVSYQELARRIGRPRASRAVAGACAANLLAVVVPCHRVVRQDGGLSGYRWGVARKRALLAREAQEE
ncbi:bifunctional DNA-binding transcriptional regulator/O6-methylguanine-DNA methyltransferase Ada [Enterobacteriaceae bacterium YMB-R22]|jgi:AraC family transcriptional regulator of adaptative response/methylated-DNA-[protein]-cysteine methyltransferase|uniref:bifunctional DNA-binding transcriptional regulator/O6-methylguanine-DNA methyltransferase Ada n=1 Tax=Tenebrionicola larvae TaxID=2815733 RepID=UPI002011CF1D|nr:bifunctional DNA-binding transcriptional regulator/O6-methylguanine-DNA methyltransferase Ada [Tenebrionicola larvae]MBV4411952.1 bifunctional DNA-binding transcriptional regulator/O6-methylguanine-DNA methyltransferase Ada [Tenebrionicola larvae]